MPDENGEEPQRRLTIVLDPGHGGRDRGLAEKADEPRSENVRMLQLAVELKSRLEKRNLNVFLTRTGDESYSLLDRGSLANRKNADVFLSLHQGRQPPVRIFIYRPPATKEKRTRALSGRLISWDDAQSAFRPQSRKLAESLRTLWAGHAAEIIEVPVAVLAGVNHPAVMVELPPAAKDWQRDAERLSQGLEKYLLDRRTP